MAGIDLRGRPLGGRYTSTSDEREVCMRKSTKIVAAVAALVGAGTIALPAAVAGAVAPTVLYVSPSANIHLNNDHHSCATAGYNSIQAAVNAAPSGSTINVCKGTYRAPLTVPASKQNLKIVGAAHSVVEPSSAPATVTDLQGGAPIIAIVKVAPGATGTSLSGLEITGSGFATSVNGCDDDLIGVLVQSTSGHAASGTLSDLDVTDTTPSNQGCGSGLGIEVESGPGSTARYDIKDNSVSAYGKNGITCGGLGVTCTISANTISSQATPLVAQNGIQVGFGASGSVTENYVAGNAYTAYSPPSTDPNPEPQGDFAAGVLLYAAGINSSGVTTTSTLVRGNTLRNDQIGVEVVDSKAAVNQNNINETGSGLVDSVGIFGVGCDVWCLYFTDHPGGATLNTVASASQAIQVEHNTINFNSTPADSSGVWLGDNSWAAAPGYAGPAGHEVPTLVANNISNVANLLTVASGA